MGGHPRLGRSDRGWKGVCVSTEGASSPPEGRPPSRAVTEPAGPSRPAATAVSAAVVVQQPMRRSPPAPSWRHAAAPGATLGASVGAPPTTRTARSALTTLQGQFGRPAAAKPATCNEDSAHLGIQDSAHLGIQRASVFPPKLPRAELTSMGCEGSPAPAGRRELIEALGPLRHPPLRLTDRPLQVARTWS